MINYIAKVNNQSPALLEAKSGLTVGAFTSVADLKYDVPVLIGAYCSFKKCQVGRYFSCGNSCSATDVTFGSFASIGDRVSFNAGQHPKESLTTHLFPYNRVAWGETLKEPPKSYCWRTPQEIGSDVWVGTNAVIMTGTTVGHGAIIAANAFVNTDVPSYAIVGGSPAKVLGYRFAEDIIRRLLKVQWWSRPMGQIERLPFDDVERCLNILEFGNDISS